MGRVIKPLEEMGATFVAEGANTGCAPLRVKGGTVKATRYEMPVASAQVKSAILLAGLFAEGKTTVVQPATTRDHTERMLADFGIRCLIEGNEISVLGGQVPEATEIQVPGDFSSAAFWLVAGAAKLGAQFRVKNVGLNPTRTALVKVLLRMGAHIQESERLATSGEPIGDLLVTGQALKGTNRFA